ncbi:hypothetical protein A4D02_10780 [Niastella koreensis]|uniref:DUF4221 domain-containing protein n=2 Tax=Niastella koreensis TaxID=354356 RepID=G8T714_NIAKG|nr:DUF4221 family protein [Niastella koreensis]AEV99035.1 hypothetical protein Niako_2696 [Niastella koreensis GR20-10]OQP43952.1 hypothetical protein A4D02_10780 [Niastella koreensis]
MRKTINIAVIILFVFAGSQACRERDATIDSTYVFIPPQYHSVQIASKPDTISIPLNDSTFNAIKSVNVFSQNGKEYLAFFDQRSGSLNIYTLRFPQPIKRIPVKEWLHHSLYKTTVYVKSFDSVFVFNQNKLYLLNSVGKIKKSVEFVEKPDNAFALFDNNNPPVFKGNHLFAGVRPYVKETSLDDLKKWKVLYAFDLHNKKASLHYHLPELYQKNIFGYSFLDYSYCYNNHGRFVFSFAADTCIYETNLADFHAAYFAKSQYQDAPITPVSKEELSTGEKQLENYITKDSYGPVYFDPYKNRYLRVVKSKISEAEYKAKKLDRTQRLLIFNENFKIIGESEIDKTIWLNTLFFTKEGGIYAQTKAGDEFALHFIRLAYSDDSSYSINQLAQNENIIK